MNTCPRISHMLYFMFQEMPLDWLGFASLTSSHSQLTPLSTIMWLLGAVFQLTDFANMHYTLEQKYMPDTNWNLASHPDITRLFTVPGCSAERARGDQWPAVICSPDLCPPDFACPEGVVQKVPLGLMAQDTTRCSSRSSGNRWKARTGLYSSLLL